MLFPTVNFALFFLTVYLVTWALAQRNTWRKAFLLVASYFFYSTWESKALFLLIACCLVNYALALLIERVASRPRLCNFVLGAGVTANLLNLFLFKYYDFGAASLSNALAIFGVKMAPVLLDWALPLGISFFTFQGISYIVDVRMGKLPARRSPLDVLFFISFFPHLVSGPIVRAHEFLPQTEAAPDPSQIEAVPALILICCGLFKKLVLANYLGLDLVDPVFQAPAQHGSVDLLLATYGYAMQIYCDFSAYSDMAIGFAALLGYKFPVNFNQPYRAQSLREFWKRWHISLSSWLRDYLYIPLGGSKGGPSKTYRNLFVTMLLGGIWHGAAWNFVFWGALHGSGLVFEHWQTRRHAAECGCKPSQAWSTFKVFHFVCLGWIFFRCDSLARALEFFKSFGNLGVSNTHLTPFTLTLVLIGGSIQFAPAHLSDWFSERLRPIPAVGIGVLVGMLVAAIAAFGTGEVAPFIYFRF